MSTLEPRPTPSRTWSEHRVLAGLRVRSVPVDDAVAEDPWCLLGHVDGSEPWFAWFDAGRDESFVAVGAAAVWSLAAASNLAGLRPHRSQLHEQLLEHPQAPTWLGGCAFDGIRSESVWRGIPAAQLRIPRWVAYRRGSDAGAVAVQEPGAPAIDLSPRPASRGREATARWSSQPSAPGYQNAVEEAVKVMRADHSLRKVVLSRTAVAQADDGFDALAMLLALRERQPEAVIFGIGFGDERAFVGASPETLARVGQGRFETQAVAGTAPRSASPARLLESVKDRHEHELVVRGIAQALEPIARSVEHKGTPNVVDAGRVRHLVTPIQAELHQGYGVLHAVDRLHPTPALCGTPREAARHHIREHEGIDRGWYGGPIGWTSPQGDGTFAVAIRSALIDGTRANAFVGAGLVAASDPALEWAETEQKLTTVASALRIRGASRR